MNIERQSEINFEAKRLSEKLLYYDAVISFLHIFGMNEIGTEVEIDKYKVAQYLCSGKFITDGMVAKEKFDKDALYKIMEEEILNGMPVWEYFIMSDWKKNIMKNSFEEEVRQIKEEMNKKYKCVTCEYFSVHNSEFGLFYDCKKEIKNGLRKRPLWQRPRVFDLQETCDYYELKEKESKEKHE